MSNNSLSRRRVLKLGGASAAVLLVPACDDTDNEGTDVMAGEMAGEATGGAAGEMAGEMAGDMAGEVTGGTAGEMVDNTDLLSDTCCTLVPYFTVQEDRLDDFKELCERFVAKTLEEEAVLYYGFTFNGNKAHCREGYRDAAGVLAHLANVGELLEEALTMASIDLLEVHGPESELEALREPLAELNPGVWTLEYGFRNESEENFADRSCTLVPYFTVNEGKMDEFKALCEQFVPQTETEDEVLFYGFSFNGDRAHCREGYKSAAGILAHLENVGGLLEQALEIATLDKLEIHGPASELDQLREPLAELSPEYWTLEYGLTLTPPVDLLDDACCTLVPYFTVQEGRMADFRALCERFVAQTRTEDDVLYYGFTFNGDRAHCREGYKNAAGVLAHLENVGALLEEALTMASLDLLEVHGPEEELAQLREPLAELNPGFWTLRYGFRSDEANMAPEQADTSCTLVPYFTIQEDKIEEFNSLCEQFVPQTETEEEVLFYGFTFLDNQAHCREGYKSANGILTHLDNVGALLGQALEIATLDKLEVHGPESELEALREPLAELNPEYWTLDYGFRR